MGIKVRISHQKLIDLLENATGKVYEHITEDDTVTGVEADYHETTITIGEAPYTEEDITCECG